MHHTTFVCFPVATGTTGKRFKCYDYKTGRSWYAGPDYKYKGKTAHGAGENKGEDAIATVDTGGKIDKFEEVGIASASDNNAIDGLRSTSAIIGENANLSIKLRDKFKNISAIGLKFKTPGKVLIEGKLFEGKDVGDKIQVFDLGKKIDTDELKVIAFGGNADIITAKVFAEGRPEGTPVPEPPSPAPAPSPGEEPTGGEGTTVKGPYPMLEGGKEYKHSVRRATRHYASGKPDDETIEANVKNIKDRNHQFVVYVTVSKMEHDDNLSPKLGGTHMGTGWFDHSVRIFDGATGLGTEPEHPETHAFVIKGPKIGDLRNKKVGVAATYFADENFTELWTDTGDGWKKQVEGKDVDGFNPKAKTFECQFRIDGFTDGHDPVFHAAVVQPIAPRKP